MNSAMKFRLRAFLIHSFISLILASAALVLVFLIWYPPPLHNAVGVSSIVLLLLGVDLIIGPLLTLVLARQGKKGLMSDLVAVAILQACAFGYGLLTIAEGRPVWLVFNNDRFDLVRAHDLENQYKKRAIPIYRTQNFTGPKWVAAKAPVDSEGRNSLLIESIASGIDLPQRPDLYIPYSEVSEQVREQSLPLSDLFQYNNADEVRMILTLWPEADAFLPLMAPVKPMSVLIDKNSARVIATVELNPWY